MKTLSWSRAPKWANFWFTGKNGNARWTEKEPKILYYQEPEDTRDPLPYAFAYPTGSKISKAPKFYFEGLWYESLAKRPTVH